MPRSVDEWETFESSPPPVSFHSLDEVDRLGQELVLDGHDPRAADHAQTTLHMDKGKLVTEISA